MLDSPRIDHKWCEGITRRRFPRAADRVRHTAAVTEVPPTYEPTPPARVAFAVNALVAWLGVGLTVVISAADAYEPTIPEPGMYGVHPEGVAGVFSRVADTLSYFTIWSNIVVALAATLLARRRVPVTGWLRVLRLDAVLMITVTALVYAVLLAPTADIVGWSRLTDPILHQVTPAVTVLVWLVFGPRRWVSGRVVLASLILPVAWIAWMLLRGAVIGTYPYDFANVAELGYTSVGTALLAILVFGVAVAAAYWALDLALRRLPWGSQDEAIT